VPGPLKSPRVALAAVLAGLVGAGALAGCGQSADLATGRALFIQRCGGCHTLAEAGTNGTQGPNLDAAFAQARSSGMDSDTIKGVVTIQVEHPRPAANSDPAISMPADLASGQDLDDIASYVASVAGVPGIKPPQQSPPQLFASNCGSCHTLKAAGTTGTTGPDLDQALPGMSSSEVFQSITDPNAKITPGYPAGVMPQNFEAIFSQTQLKGLVKYLLANAGK
jgi:mono/diheme cytochrome c family protein